jgi:hypothetical protein
MALDSGDRVLQNHFAVDLVTKSEIWRDHSARSSPSFTAKRRDDFDGSTPLSWGGQMLAAGTRENWSPLRTRCLFLKGPVVRRSNIAAPVHQMRLSSPSPAQLGMFGSSQLQICSREILHRAQFLLKVVYSIRLRASRVRGT